MTIRRMTLEDVTAVHAIEQATFSTPWSRQSFLDEMQRNACARYLVAEENGEIIGYGGAWMIFEEGHITNVAVRKEHRGKGIGRALMQALMQYAANLGVQYMTLEVRKSNEPALNLYKSLGFLKLGVRKQYYEDNGEDALLLVCDQMPPMEADFSEQD